jgi:hypothetical protein
VRSAFKFLIAGIALVVVVGLGAVLFSLYQEPTQVPSNAESAPSLASRDIKDLRTAQQQDNVQQKAAADQATPQCPAANPAGGYASGKYVYRLSNEVFAPSASLEKEIRDRYGNNADLADWEDLKALLVNEDDVRKFIADTGIRLQGKNYDCDNILVSRSGSETIQGLHYHLARHDGAIPPNWSILDSVGSNDIHLGRWNHSGQALLRIAQTR